MDLTEIKLAFCLIYELFVQDNAFLLIFKIIFVTLRIVWMSPCLFVVAAAAMSGALI